MANSLVLNKGPPTHPHAYSNPPANEVLGIFLGPPTIPTSLLLGTKE